jgi:energy-coupling factor transport system substrate-specific component
MKTLRATWGDTRMVVLTALSAALYAAILIPFKLFPLIPGVTEIRPANAVPIVCSLLFGPAGAWGSAIGNLVGDFFGTLSPMSLFGFLGNFLYGFAPYALWRAMFGNVAPRRDLWSHRLGLGLVILVASAICALVIAWGSETGLGFLPFAYLGTIIFFNNLVVSLVLAPPLYFALVPRVRRWELEWTAILPAAVSARPRLARLGAILFIAGSLGGFGAGLGIATGVYDQHISIPKYMVRIWQTVVAPKISGESAPALTATATGSGAKRSVAVAPATHGKPAPVLTATATGGAVAARPPKTVKLTGLGLSMLPALALVAAGVLLL